MTAYRKPRSGLNRYRSGFENSALGVSTPGALCIHQEKNLVLEAKRPKFTKFSSLPALVIMKIPLVERCTFLPIYLYMKKDTKNNEVHLSPRSSAIAVCKDNKNNLDAKTDTIIVANYGLGRKSQQ